MRHTTPRQSADQLEKNRICKVLREFLETGSSPVFRPVRDSRKGTPILAQAYPQLPADNQYFFLPNFEFICSFASPVASSHRSRHAAAPCQLYTGFQRRLGLRAAVASSNRPTTVVDGACLIRSGFVVASSAIFRIIAMNASRVSRLSVSVGSIIRASATINGK